MKRSLKSHDLWLNIRKSLSTFVDSRIGYGMTWILRGEYWRSYYATTQGAQFWPLESIIRSGEEMEKDINHRIQVSWVKWRNISVVICVRKAPLKSLKEIKFQEEKSNVLEIRMLQWMSGHTRKDIIMKWNNTC